MRLTADGVYEVKSEADLNKGRYLCNGAIALQILHCWLNKYG